MHWAHLSFVKRAQTQSSLIIRLLSLRQQNQMRKQSLGRSALLDDLHFGRSSLNSVSFSLLTKQRQHNMVTHNCSCRSHSNGNHLQFKAVARPLGLPFVFVCCKLEIFPCNQAHLVKLMRAFVYSFWTTNARKFSAGGKFPLCQRRQVRNTDKSLIQSPSQQQSLN